MSNPGNDQKHFGSKWDAVDLSGGENLPSLGNYVTSLRVEQNCIPDKDVDQLL